MNSKCCKDCKNRTVEPNCHETCPIYLQFCKENEHKKELIRKGRENERIVPYKSNRYY